MKSVPEATQTRLESRINLMVELEIARDSLIESQLVLLYLNGFKTDYLDELYRSAQYLIRNNEKRRRI